MINMRINYTNVGIAISALAVCFILFRLAQRSDLVATQEKSQSGKSYLVALFTV